MKRFLGRALRVTITLAVVAVAAVFGWNTWTNYTDTPWTRDGHVRADIVGVAPDVSGLVSDVKVADNQTVKAGDVLLTLDKARFDLALRLAEAGVSEADATLKQAQKDAQRYQSLSRDVASEQTVEKAVLAADTAGAAYQEAVASRDLAKLNLERAEIRAPSNGIVTNLALNPGDYVTAGKAVMALIDTDTIRVEGYFEENQLPKIAVGDPVKVELMGQSKSLSGRVESIAGGIEDRERTDGINLLANVTPTFSWVRLAQRVPVRIALDTVPDNVRLVAGLTATVSVRPDDTERSMVGLSFLKALHWPLKANAAEETQ